MNKTILKLLAGSLLMIALIVPAQAKAHGVAVAGLHLVERAGHPAHRGYRHDYRAPRWLERDRDFMHWYGRSHYRHGHQADWYRIFEIYLHEISHRKYRKYDRRHYYDYDYRDRGRNRHRDRHRWRY
jgi:hypothetical protein